MSAQSGWLRWEPPGLRRFGYSGRVLVAGILPDIARTGWHWKIMDGLKPPRRERWTLRRGSHHAQRDRVMA
jgi:hypothetical protein